MDLILHVHRLGRASVLLVCGEVDLATAPRLRTELVNVVSERPEPHLVIDLDGVTFMDSIGLGVLVGALRRVRSRGGRIDLVCTGEQALRLFALTGLDQVFPIHPSVDVALGEAWLCS